jgi:hypothetical protein
MYFSIILCVGQCFSIVSVCTIRGTDITYVLTFTTCFDLMGCHLQNTRRKPTGKKTHIGIRQQELAKRARQQKKGKYIYI